MQHDLIFHAVSRRQGPTLNKEGTFAPEDYDPETGFIWALPQPLEEYLNASFSGRKNLLLLVIDVTRLATDMRKTRENGYIRVYQPINIDAILDRIRIDANEDGEFDVSVKSFT